MMTSVSAKRCPKCGKAAVLQAVICPACGHEYRTRFAEPAVHRTEAFSLMLLPSAAPAAAVRRPRPARSFALAFWSSFLLVAVAGSLLWLGWSVWQWPPQATLAATAPAGTSAAHPAPPIRSASADPAGHLYKTIDLAMSLYQLDRAAGGTGRVIPCPDPHTLLLSYDYPPRSVRVSLSRTDLSGGDYQVQTVALYRGKTLLQRHAQMD